MIRMNNNKTVVLVIPILVVLPYLQFVNGSTGIFESNNKDLIVTNMSVVLDYSSPKDYGDKINVLGIIKNTGNITYENVPIVASLYDNKSNLLGVIEGEPIFNVDPNSNSPFKITDWIRNFSDLDHFSIMVRDKAIK